MVVAVNLAVGTMIFMIWKVSNEVSLFSEGDAPFAMSPKDLKLIESIPKIIEIGIDSLKVEGRMKSIHYIATVVRVYRKVIDAYCSGSR